MATLKTILGGVAALAFLAGGAVAFNTSGDNVAQAQTGSAKATVDAAKARGEIGEQIDGYLGVVDGASPSANVINAYKEINIARKTVYTRVAQKNSQPVNFVSQLTGEKQIKKATSGKFVKDATDTWKKK